MTVPVDGGHSVSFGISGRPRVPGAPSGSSVSYPGARPDSTVSFTAGTGLVKESIVLSSPSAPTTWVFPLELKGLRAEMGPGGIVEFADSAGKVLAYVPRGFMTDSDIDPHSGNGATSFGVTYSLVTAGGRPAIKMTLDAGWLDGKSRVYPVTVDPSVADEGTDGTTYVMSPYDNDYSGDTEIDVGTYDGGTNVAESYLDFSSVASELKNDTVLGVRLGLFNTWSYSCSPREVYVYPVTSAWSVTGDKSCPGRRPGPRSAAAVSRPDGCPTGSSSSPCPASWEGIDLDQGGTEPGQRVDPRHRRRRRAGGGGVGLRQLRVEEVRLQDSADGQPVPGGHLHDRRRELRPGLEAGGQERHPDRGRVRSPSR